MKMTGMVNMGKYFTEFHFRRFSEIKVVVVVFLHGVVTSSIECTASLASKCATACALTRSKVRRWRAEKKTPVDSFIEK